MVIGLEPRHFMYLATLTNEFEDGFGNLRLLPGIWLESPSNTRIDPQVTICGLSAHGWKFKFSIFLSRTNPPHSILADAEGRGLIVNQASYKLAESKLNGNFTAPTDELKTHADLLLLVQINGNMQDLTLNNSADRVIYTQMWL